MYLKTLYSIANGNYLFVAQGNGHPITDMYVARIIDSNKAVLTESASMSKIVFYKIDDSRNIKLGPESLLPAMHFLETISIILAVFIARRARL